MKFYDRLLFSCLLLGEQSMICTSINYEKKRQLNSQRFMDYFLCVLRKMVRM